jgi:hypothetical protein
MGANHDTSTRHGRIDRQRNVRTKSSPFHPASFYPPSLTSQQKAISPLLWAALLTPPLTSYQSKMSWTTYRNPYVVVVVESSSNKPILKYTKIRYRSEDDLIRDLVRKTLDPQVISANFTRTNDKVHVCVLVRGCNRHSARILMHGVDYAWPSDRFTLRVIPNSESDNGSGPGERAVLQSDIKEPSLRRTNQRKEG